MVVTTWRNMGEFSTKSRGDWTTFSSLKTEGKDDKWCYGHGPDRSWKPEVGYKFCRSIIGRGYRQTSHTRYLFDGDKEFNFEDCLSEEHKTALFGGNNNAKQWKIWDTVRYG